MNLAGDAWEAGAGDRLIAASTLVSSRRRQAPRPSFFRTFPKKCGSNAKLFQEMFWRFCGISTGCNRSKPQLMVSKFLSPKQAREAAGRPVKSGSAKQPIDSVALISFFRKKKVRGRREWPGLALAPAFPPRRKARGQTRRSAIIDLMLAIALAGLRPLGQVLAQFMMVWQRYSRNGSSRSSSRSPCASSRESISQR